MEKLTKLKPWMQIIKKNQKTIHTSHYIAMLQPKTHKLLIYTAFGKINIYFY